MPATEATDVRVVYEGGRVVLGVVLHDSEPNAVFQNQMQRDGSFDTDDSFAWIIDSFLDGRTGYFFEINPAGAMGDGLVTLSGGGGGRWRWRRRWWWGRWRRRRQYQPVVGRYLDGARAPHGYGVERRNRDPFRTLNFNPNLTAWGINFRRTVRRKNEESLWTSYALNQGLTRVVSAGRVEGLSDVSQGLGLDLKPYAVGESVVCCRSGPRWPTAISGSTPSTTSHPRCR